MKAFLIAAAALGCTLGGAATPTSAAVQKADVDAGYSVDKLYNLANSYARAGQPGLAVLNYERAALLAPEDSDILANLNAVRASLHLPPKTRGRGAFAARIASPNTVAWIGVCGVVLAGASLIAARVSHRHRALRMAAILVGVTAVVFTAANALVQGPLIREAVVIVKETPLRVAPVPMSDILAQLPETEFVTVDASREDFVLVRNRTGRSGWVARADVADVVPTRSP